MPVKIDINKVFRREYIAFLLGLIAILYISRCESCSNNSPVRDSQTAKSNIQAEKKKLPGLQEKKQEVNSQIKVLTPKREKEIQKFETLKHDSVPCPEIISQCDTVIKYDNELIVSLNNVIKIDSSIIAIQQAIMTNQDVVIEAQELEIKGLKKKIKKHRLQKFLIVTVAVLTGGFLIAK